MCITPQIKVKSTEQVAVESRAKKGRAEKFENKSAISKFVRCTTSSVLLLFFCKFLDRSEQNALLLIEFRAEQKFRAFVNIGPYVGVS